MSGLACVIVSTVFIPTWKTSIALKARPAAAAAVHLQRMDQSPHEHSSAVSL